MVVGIIHEHINITDKKKEQIRLTIIYLYESCVHNDLCAEKNHQAYKPDQKDKNINQKILHAKNIGKKW